MVVLLHCLSVVENYSENVNQSMVVNGANDAPFEPQPENFENANQSMVVNDATAAPIMDESRVKIFLDTYGSTVSRVFTAIFRSSSAQHESNVWSNALSIAYQSILRFIISHHGQISIFTTQQSLDYLQPIMDPMHQNYYQPQPQNYAHPQINVTIENSNSSMTLPDQSNLAVGHRGPQGMMKHEKPTTNIVMKHLQN